ncbi:MAG: GGDEF/HDGYP domain-containing response regulator [Thermodesulfobacteriota bacterium]
MQTNETIKILLMDERPEQLAALEEMLRRPDLIIMKATSAKEAMMLSLAHDFAMLVMDAQANQKDDCRTADMVGGSEAAGRLPIIYITDIHHHDQGDFQGCDSSAVDYVFKPLNPAILRNKVNMFLSFHRQKKDLESASSELRQKLAELNKSKEIIEKQNRKLSELVIRDSLTGLYNRHHLQNIISQEFARAKRYRTDFSCLLMDLDFFKQINDYCGHACGDYVLREFGGCLARFTRRTDYAFRYGGEEFLLLLPHTDIQGAMARGEAIRKWSEERVYRDGDRKITVTVSIGIASLVMHRPERPRDMIALADKALYQAKAEGRNRVTIYQEKGSEGVAGQGEKAAGQKDLRYLKENLSAILEKTKKASLESLELLVRDLGGDRFRNHNRRVTQYLNLFGDKLGLSPSLIDSLKRAVTFHDCFKILLSDSILYKQGDLTDTERSEIESHPGMLADLTGLFNFFAEEREVLLHHHEHYDGTGYPNGLSGDRIPVGARVFAIVDALVAMTSERTYRKKMSMADALRELEVNAGRQFDPELVRTAVKLNMTQLME